MGLAASMRRWLRGRSSGSSRHDLGVIGTWSDAGGAGVEGETWQLEARLFQRRGAWTLVLVLEHRISGEPERWNLRLPMSAAERLEHCLREALQAVEAGSPPRSDPGARIALRLMRLEGHDLVRSWTALGDDPDRTGDRLPDLHLLLRQSDHASRLLFYGHNAEGGLWPLEVVEPLLRELPRLGKLAAGE
jgi:hypothetical protein